MKILKKIFSFALFANLLILQQISYSQNYSFKNYNHDNGLTDNYIECIYEDSRGFMWIGSRAGLNRFDGHSFIHIPLPKMKSASSHEVGQHFINAITEDNENKIWIGTLAGIYVYDIFRDSYEMYEHIPHDSTSVSFNLIEHFSLDKDNNMWVATREGLNKFDKNKKNFIRYKHNPDINNGLRNNYIFSLLHDHANNLWIGTLTGGLHIIPNGQQYISQKIESKTYLYPEVRSIYEDSKQNIWLVTSQEGIYVKYSKSKVFQKFETPEYTKNAKFFTALTDICEDTHGNLWISSFMGGVAILNPTTKSMQFYKEDMPAPYNICGNSIKALYRDKAGNMWICSHGGGISIYSPLASTISSYTKSPFKNSIPGNIISCFEEDTFGTMYIGTDGSGLTIHKPSKKTFTNIGIADGLASDAILAITEIKPGILAIGSWNGGLNIYNTKTNSMSKHVFKSQESSTIALNIYGLYFDKKTNLLWCNTFGDGIIIFDCTTYSFLSEQELSKIFPFWNNPKFTSKVLLDSVNKCIWFIDGIVLGRVINNNAEFFYESDSAKNCSNGLFCSDIMQTQNGTVYVSSFKGVSYFNPKTNCLQNITFPNISFSDSKALLEDAHGNIWITTNDALYKYNPKLNTIKNMSHVWGMPRLQYVKKSAFRSRDGHLYFGSLKGFVVLHEDSTYTYNITPSIYITKLFINNIEQHPGMEYSPLKKDIILLNELTLLHNQSFITLEFGILNFIDNQKSVCKFKLVGFDKDWIYAGKERRATYTNIPPGNYTFLVSTTNSEGNWIETPHAFKITVLPPWWQTGWFKFIIILLCIVAIAVFIILRERNIKQTNKQLECMVDNKTAELQTANQQLLEQKNTIEKHYENLREQQLLIEIKNTQLQEALNTKSKLLTVIAHDFKNPLSTLLMYANMLKDKIFAKRFDEIEPNIVSIVNSAETIYSQMVEVLEWSVSKDDAVQCHPIDINVETLLKDVLSLTKETASQKNILIETNFNLSSTAHVDPRMMSTILRNLIINSIKFTPKHGKISITLIEQKSHIEIILKDTGVGMGIDQIERILSEKHVIAEDYRSGFGLQICKTFIKRNNGSFTITSEIDKGSTFYVSIPKGSMLEKVVLQQKEIIYSPLVEFEDEDNQRKMLVIDDNEEITNYLHDVFCDSFQVIKAFNGKEGIDKALQTIPEIILSDINMPLLNGKELCKQLKSNSLTNHIPIILISAQTLPHEQIDGLQHGADDYIAKPFDANILKQKVHILLKNRDLLIDHLKQSINTTEKFNLPDSFDDKIIKDITNVIIENISNVEFKVDMLAQKVGLSRSQLYRKTVSVLGQSPNDYIKSLRLQQAVEMLKTGRYRISEIAYEVGFSDPGYFSSCFFEKFGVKPSDYGKMK